MLKHFINASILTGLGLAVYLSGGMDTLLEYELQSNGNPFRSAPQSPEFVKRSIASESAKNYARNFDRRVVQDMQIYKNYEEDLSRLRLCLNKVCPEIFEKEEVQKSYDKYETYIISKINTNLGHLYTFALKRGFKGHGIISTVGDFSDISNTEVQKNIVLILTSQDRDERSINILMNITKYTKSLDVRRLIVNELNRYTKDEKFKESLSDQIVALMRSSTINHDIAINNELYSFIDKDNYKKI